MTIIDDLLTIIENVGAKYTIFIPDFYLDVFDIYFCTIHHMICIFIVYISSIMKLSLALIFNSFLLKFS